MRLEGIHHVSAITGDAARNVDFYARVLGLRLVAKTVNQDDPSVYHLFYADEQGRPGAEMTFFEYPHATPGRAGAGMVHTVVWRVGSSEAPAFWERRLAQEGVASARTSEGRLRFSDPEGLAHELKVADAPEAPLVADHPEIPHEVALQGFEGVRAYSAAPELSALVLEQLLGAERVGTGLAELGAEPTDVGGSDTWELRGEARGGTVTFDPAPQEPGRQSAGVVHHVAFGTTAAEHPRWETRLREAGVPTSGIVDRHYFHSIYFREPGGVLYEIADDAPGFTVDSPQSELGRRIILPPRFEPQRERIEARLTPLPDPRADWPAATTGAPA